MVWNSSCAGQPVCQRLHSYMWSIGQWHSPGELHCRLDASILSFVCVPLGALPLSPPLVPQRTTIRARFDALCVSLQLKRIYTQFRDCSHLNNIRLLYLAMHLVESLRPKQCGWRTCDHVCSEGVFERILCVQGQALEPRRTFILIGSRVRLGLLRMPPTTKHLGGANATIEVLHTYWLWGLMSTLRLVYAVESR